MLGVNAKFYRNTGSYAVPVWTEVPELENVVIDPRYQAASSNSRDSQFERVMPALVGVAVSARLKVKPTNTNYEALMDALALSTTVDLLILDGSKDTVGARGIRAECYLMAGRDDQGIQNRLYRDLEIALADTDNPPKWAKVGAGPTLQFAVPGGAWA